MAARERSAAYGPEETAAALQEGWRDDMELFEILTGIDGGSVADIPRAMGKLAGPEAVEGVRESLRGEDGVLRITACRQWVYDVIEAANAKNS